MSNPSDAAILAAYERVADASDLAAVHRPRRDWAGRLLCSTCHTVPPVDPDGPADPWADLPIPVLSPCEPLLDALLALD